MKGGRLRNFLTTSLILMLQFSYEKNKLFAQHFVTIVILDLVINYNDKTFDSEQLHFILFVILKTSYRVTSFNNISLLKDFCGSCHELSPTFQTVFNAAITAFGLSF